VYCESERIVKNRKEKAVGKIIQLHRCKDCGRRFNERSGTPMARLRTEPAEIEMSSEGLGLRATGRVISKSGKSLINWEQRLPRQMAKWSLTAPAEGDFFQIQNTRWLFLALCFYIISQGYTIPLLAVGPTWALWPCLSDLAIVVLVLIFLISFRHTSPLPKPAKSIFSILLLIIYGSIFSHLCYLPSAPENAPGKVWGIYQIFRLIQFIGVFFIAAKIPLTEKRISILTQVVGAVFLFVCLGVFLTYLGIVPLSSVTAHLPLDGPWPEYAAFAGSGVGRGLGFVGYNYAYTAVQIILLISLKLGLSDYQKKGFYNSGLVLLSVVSCFLSSSRSGLIAILLYSIIYWLNMPKSWSKSSISLVAVVVIISISILCIGNHINFNLAGQDSTIERQANLFSSSNSEQLSESGRNDIWEQRVEFLNKDFIKWIVGSGFGSALDSGNFAHMLPLQIVLETGFVGLLIFILLFYKILRYFYLHEVGIKPIFLGTVILLFTSASQETFYPMPAFQHFLGFYLCALAISFQKHLPHIPQVHDRSW
jgi:transposase-like protein/O-antigen ligase